MAGYGSCIKNYSNLIRGLGWLAGAVLIVMCRQQKTRRGSRVNALMLGSDFFVVCWLGILWRRLQSGRLLQRCVV